MPYERILSPITIRNVTLKNRVIRTAHGTSIGAREPGGIGPNFIGYHLARARGGVALTILEICSIHFPSCRASLESFNPGLPDGYKRLVDAVKPHGMALMQQLWHSGAHAVTHDGSPPWAPSDVPGPAMGIVPVIMTKTMIHELIGGYVKAARIAKDAGLDGVEVHSAHSYLPQQFLSPVTNRREDEYGGSFENRMRFLLEVLEGIRREVGNDFLMSVRLSVDGLAASMGIEENKRVLETLERSRLIDFVNFSWGSYFLGSPTVGGMHYPTGYQLEVTAKMGAKTKLPRLVAGRFRTLEEADQVIRLGQADMVSMVRATIADPNLVKKTIEGRVDDVRPCIACNQACIGNELKGVPLGCAVNPTTGVESMMEDDKFVPASSSKKVLVIGGGPAGMEAARVAALRGHKVTLVEASKALGGQLNFAKKAPFRVTIGDIADWQERQLYKLGVEVTLNTYFESQDVLAEKADAVIVATGSSPRMDGIFLSEPSLPIAGLDQHFVVSSHDVMSNPPKNLSGKVVIDDDVGHYEGIAVAEFLLSRGVEQVIFVTRFASLAPYMEAILIGVPARLRLNRTGRFRLLPDSSILGISGNGTVEISAALGTRQELVEAQLVVLISHNRCNRTIFDELQGRQPRIELIGDAKSPRYLETAIKEGNLAGRAI